VIFYEVRIFEFFAAKQLQFRRHYVATQASGHARWKEFRRKKTKFHGLVNCNDIKFILFYSLTFLQLAAPLIVSYCSC